MGTDDGGVFGPVRSESTAVLVARKLREIISQGYLKPGQQLVEVQLAKQFGVSRGVLREAMQRLTQEGLLLSRPNRGVFVVEYTADDVFDIYTARLAVERGACLKVIDITHRTEELAAALDELTDRFEARAAEGASIDHLVWLDIEFHECLVAEAESPRLLRMHATLATESRMCLAYENGAYPVGERIREHREITAAIRDRDVARLNRVLAEHMDHAVAMIQQQFESSVERTGL